MLAPAEPQVASHTDEHGPYSFAQDGCNAVVPEMKSTYPALGRALVSVLKCSSDLLLFSRNSVAN
eukprot:COSAG02_NODE_614_length_19515_cov_6.651937_16_plen_65_part_00